VSQLIRAAGAVVYTFGPDGELLILLIRDRHGAYTLPKGHLEAGESDEEAAVREIAEETGIACAIERPLARMRYPIYKRGSWRDKEVAYFLARAPFALPTPARDEGITAAEWARPDEVVHQLTYAQVREVVRKAIAALRAQRP
jgi:8-oxo-dGTP pyrophosphatase MutT (NUDIX family)